MHPAATSLHASHVNTGTSVPRAELFWPEDEKRPVSLLPKLHAEIDARSEVTEAGGLALAATLCARLRMQKILDEHVAVLRRHRPFHESDHVLAQALNLYSGGTCLEDLADLQHSEAVRRILGAGRLPDPTTAGDFLRRFDDELNHGSLDALRRANDEIQSGAWKQIAGWRQRRSRAESHKKGWTFVDVDGHLEETTGAQHEADFSRQGKWSYQPLAVTLAGTGEVLALRNRTGNVPASTGAAEVVSQGLERVVAHFGKAVVVRGDSEFDRADMRQACEAKSVYFAFVGRELKNRPDLAAAIPETGWSLFVPRAARAKAERTRSPRYRARARKENRRRAAAAARGFKDLHLAEQCIAEVPYTPPEDDSKTYRLVVRRQLVEHRHGQQTLFTEYRYRYVTTNLPRSWSTIDVIDATYQRCDQENVIAELGNGIAAWRMPVAELAGNSAWLEIARLAWNMGKWIAQLALAPEVVRWEWKRFRRAFVLVPAQVVRRANQTWIRLSGSHRFAGELLAALERLQT